MKLRLGLKLGLVVFAINVLCLFGYGAVSSSPVTAQLPLKLGFAALAALGAGLAAGFLLGSCSRFTEEVKKILAAFNEGNFTARPHAASKEPVFREVYSQLDTLRSMLNTWIYELLHTSVSVNTSAVKIDEASVRTTEGMENLNTGLNEIRQFFEETSENLSDIARAASELAQSGKSIADQSAMAAATAKEASDAATSGEDAVSKVCLSMKEIREDVEKTSDLIKSLEETSRQIGQISGTITSISEQTNMLALNAAIEAARAGENGRGFAVVSEEVRKLADESRQAAAQISDLVKEVSCEVSGVVEAILHVGSRVEEGVGIAALAGDNLRDILDAVVKVKEMNSIIKDGASRQSGATGLISESTGKVADKTHSGTASVEEIACVVENQLEDVRINRENTAKLAKISGDLESIMDRFDHMVGEQMLGLSQSIAQILDNKALSNEELTKLSEKTGLSEIHILNEKGLVVNSSNSAILGFQFSSKKGDQTYEFMQIFKDPSLRVNQKAAFRDVDGKLFKYTGVAFNKGKGLVQCGLDASRMVFFKGREALKAL